MSKNKAAPDAADEVAIEPSPHYFLPTVPHVAQVVDAKTAARLVKSGAFTYAARGGYAEQLGEPPDNPPPADADEQPEGPADAGSSDSEEN